MVTCQDDPRARPSHPRPAVGILFSQYGRHQFTLGSLRILRELNRFNPIIYTQIGSASDDFQVFHHLFTLAEQRMRKRLSFFLTEGPANQCKRTDGQQGDSQPQGDEEW